jgi:hypothetical protein
MFLFGKKISKKKVSQFQDLKEKWTIKHKSLQESLWQNHGHVLNKFASTTQQVAMGSLASIIMLGSSGMGVVKAMPLAAKSKPYQPLGKTSTMLLDLKSHLPSTVSPLSSDQKQKIADILSSTYGIKVTPQLQGIQLNRVYGYIGQEQHLMRFPGDTIDTHFAAGEDAQQYYDYGMAPGRGAWGYFANSSSQMTQEDSLREKYYIAVQTFLAPGYMDNVAKYNAFFKYRKMLVVNPDNGKALVADIADAGPSEWTGKQLGGSPEVMKYLERVDGAQKGPVLYFFIDDANNTVPLGPVSLQ